MQKICSCREPEYGLCNRDSGNAKGGGDHSRKKCSPWPGEKAQIRHMQSLNWAAMFR